MNRDYGDNLNWFLQEAQGAESYQVEDGEIEIYGETAEGAEGSCTVDVRELCGAALSRITELEGFWVGEPNEQCHWWWWNEDEDTAPIPVSILFSGTNKEYFASAGQYGWTQAQYVKDMGGKWLKIVEPEIPSKCSDESYT